MTRAETKTRSDYILFTPIQTRWMDNDAFGHVNNVTYYSYFDTAVNRYLVGQGLLDIQNSEIVGVVAETGCQYFQSVAFPDELEVGISVARLGRSSVRYEIGIFKKDAPECCAAGHFVHVYIDRASGRPVPLTPELRAGLEKLSRHPDNAGEVNNTITA